MLAYTALIIYLLIGTLVVFVSWKANQAKYDIDNDMMPLMMLLVMLFWPACIIISITISFRRPSSKEEDKSHEENK